MLIPIVLGTLTVLAFGLALASLKGRLTVVPETIENGVLLKVKVPKNNEQGPLAAEMMFAALHGMLQEEGAEAGPLSFEIVSSAGGISFYIFVSADTRRFVESQVYAQYPSAEIQVVDDYTNLDLNDEGIHVAGTEVILEREYFLPIKTFPDFEVDPLAAITSSVENLTGDAQAWLQMMVKPLPEGWQEPGYKHMEVLRTGKAPEGRSIITVLSEGVVAALVEFFRDVFVGLLVGPSYYMNREAGGIGEEEKNEVLPEEKAEIEAVQTKLSLLGFEASIRVIGVGESEEEAIRDVSSYVASLKQFTVTHNGFVRTEIVKQPEVLLAEYQARSMPAEMANRFVLNTEELASVFHLPSVQMEVPNIG